MLFAHERAHVTHRHALVCTAVVALGALPAFYALDATQDLLELLEHAIT
ncbi:hypothetical protein [Streptomyces sp. CC224E]|nr:hypothetical protein [Streptomyces sp. CC224E]